MRQEITGRLDEDEITSDATPLCYNKSATASGTSNWKHINSDRSQESGAAKSRKQFE